jgi:type IV secretion system protein TrbF
MNIFSHKELVPAAPAGNGQVEQTANPYLDARRQSNSQIDRAFGSLHVWQLIAVASLLIAFACVAGIIYFGSQTKFVPYVIEVDKLGEAVAVGPAQLAAPADPRVVRASLASFIAAARLVTPDIDLQRKARSAKVTVNTDISTVLPITENTWEVDWQETTRDRDGSLVGQPIIMRATLEIYIVPPSTDARQTEIQRNPLGIYVRDFNWQQR